MPRRNFLARLYRPDPAPPAFADGKTLPQTSSSIFSQLIFHWVTPLLNVGFTRPLEKEDLWTLDESRCTAFVTDRVSRNFKARSLAKAAKDPQTVGPAEGPTLNPSPYEHNAVDKKIGPDDDIEMPVAHSNGNTDRPLVESEKDKADEKKPGMLSPLVMALITTFAPTFWTAGIFLLVGETLTACTPLLTQKLLTYLTVAYYHKRYPDEIPAPHSVGYGLGWVFGIFAMQVTTSFCTQHHQQRTMSVGMQVRNSVTGMIFAKAMRLSHRSRMIHSTGKITTMVSSDVARLEDVAPLFH
ncbi:hypothetical protein FRB94_007425 [Tulasnella sp. JGI-2019a]|nr:hypothetical protein FRB94_007425 [Tulasnella sp. JGI-2019a]